MDEPWSRPGDYVLLRAMTDLVCASSSCPDDIDPANGWQVTPIHVRVYAPDNTFSMAIARRVTADADPSSRRRRRSTRARASARRASSSTAATGCRTASTTRARSPSTGRAGRRWPSMDLSPLRKWEILGPDAETLVQHAITRDARRLSVGQVTYTALCNETGGMIDDATVYRLGAGQLPLRRRRRVRRDLAEGARRPARAQGLGEAVDGAAPQRRRPGPREPRAPEEDRLDAAVPDVARGSALVPVHDRPDRDIRRDPDRRLAHRATRASSATRCGATPSTGRRSGTRSGKRERIMA